jgi:hypothetical protein
MVMNIRLRMLTVVIAAFTLLEGCITIDHRSPSDGKTGVINQIYSRHDLRYKAPSCLYTLTPEQMAAGTYVQIRVVRDAGTKYFDALVPAAMEVRTGDEVTFSSDQCERSAIPQVTQVLRHKG